jgi:hypothetical protein
MLPAKALLRLVGDLYAVVVAADGQAIPRPAAGDYLRLLHEPTVWGQVEPSVLEAWLRVVDERLVDLGTADPVVAYRREDVTALLGSLDQEAAAEDASVRAAA